MDEQHYDPEQLYSNEALSNAIRGNLVNLLIGAGVCFYLGFTWLADAPGSVSEQAAETWYLIDNIMRWALRIVGLLFLFAIAATSTGKQSSMLVVVLAEAGFTIMMFIMAIESTVEALKDGLFDPFAILLLVLGIFGISSVKRSWQLYCPPRRDV